MKQGRQSNNQAIKVLAWPAFHARPRIASIGSAGPTSRTLLSLLVDRPSEIALVTDSNTPLRVIASPAFRNEAANPYNALLYRALSTLGVVVEESSSRALVRAAADIWHVHWPDIEIGRGAPETWFLNAAKFLIQIAIARFRGIRIVWTVHNLKPHDRRFSSFQDLVFGVFLRSLSAWISLTQAARDEAVKQFAVLQRIPSFVIPHGNYRGVYPDGIGKAEARRSLGVPSDSKVLLFFGQIRPYKDVPRLIEAFELLEDQTVHLVIAGHAPDSNLQDEIIQLARANPRIHLELALISSDRVQLFMRAADLVVLPYRAILNSGAVLLALSFQRPVLVPHKGSMAELQHVFGDRWVMTYRGPLGAIELTAALGSALELGATQLKHLESAMAEVTWERIAAETVRAYRAALGAL